MLAEESSYAPALVEPLFVLKPVYSESIILTAKHLLSEARG